MDNTRLSALLWLIAAVAYQIWAYKQSGPILLHRQLTFCCLLASASGFWLWGELVEFISGVVGFMAGWLYLGVRSALKAQHLFGKQIADRLTQQGL